MYVCVVCMCVCMCGMYACMYDGMSVCMYHGMSVSMFLDAMSLCTFVNSISLPYC